MGPNLLSTLTEYTVLTTYGAYLLSTKAKKKAHTTGKINRAFPPDTIPAFLPGTTKIHHHTPHSSN
jgi:hypothetical protein